MINKKQGTINEIIYNNTVYNKGKYRYYPTITDLKGIIREIIDSESTTQYVRINPFYVNEKLDMQIEFDDYMFYLECRDAFDSDDLSKHIADCIGKEYSTLTEKEKGFGRMLYPLCEYKDIESYKKILEGYSEFLYELIPILMKIAKSKIKLKEEDLAFGYFCFEIHSQ